MTICAYLRAYAARKPLRMHMPGHKGKLDPLDLTEIAPAGLGPLAARVAEAERETARAYGAPEARYLTGGATLGLLAALIALPPGRVLVPRCSHRSIFAGCELSRREPYLVETAFADGLPSPLGAGEVERALAREPGIVGAVATSPDYYGRTADLAAIRAVLGPDRYLIVDAAHGAHFGLRPELPTLPLGPADATVVSAHKTLPALTQTAIAFPAPRLSGAYDAALALLASTSPSYPLLASIEDGVARARETDVTRLIAAARRVPYRIPGDDPLRIVLDARAARSNGPALAEYLAAAGIEPEFADARYVVLIGSCMDTPEEYARLGALLGAAPPASAAADCAPPPPRRAAGFLWAGEREEVRLETAAGRVLAGEVGWYPPCTPLGVRGDLVTAELVTALGARESFGVRQGRIAVRC